MYLQIFPYGMKINFVLIKFTKDYLRFMAEFFKYA